MGEAAGAPGLLRGPSEWPQEHKGGYMCMFIPPFQLGHIPSVV